jgi:uncharacterized membrane protein YdfJ with MMPL/SSD domain
VTFAPVLIGLADNLGIHLAARYSEERTAGHNFRTAMEIAARQTGPGIVTAGLSVILAFYAVMLANFPGLAELGFIAGSGELLCMVASFTVLPALFAVSQRYLRTRATAWQVQERAGVGIGWALSPSLRWRAWYVNSLGCSCRRSRSSTTTCCISGQRHWVSGVGKPSLEESDRSSWYALSG